MNEISMETVDRYIWLPDRRWSNSPTRWRPFTLGRFQKEPNLAGQGEKKKKSEILMNKLVFLPFFFCPLSAVD